MPYAVHAVHGAGKAAGREEMREKSFNFNLGNVPWGKFLNGIFPVCDKIRPGYPIFLDDAGIDTLG